jgi:hypothetical protein
VADLIAHGLMNPADRQAVVHRRADRRPHVGRIIAKLGCANRAQVAAIAAAASAVTAAIEHGIPGPSGGGRRWGDGVVASREADSDVEAAGGHGGSVHGSAVHRGRGTTDD